MVTATNRTDTLPGGHFIKANSPQNTRYAKRITKYGKNYFSKFVKTYSMRVPEDSVGAAKR